VFTTATSWAAGDRMVVKATTSTDNDQNFNFSWGVGP
jgi:hypothetical protein